MADLSLDTISGQITMKPQDHQAIRDTFVGEVVKAGDGMAFKVIATVPPTDATKAPEPGLQGPVAIGEVDRRRPGRPRVATC